MAKGSAFSRTMTYFREATLDEAIAALGQAVRIIDERQAATGAKHGPVRHRRGRRANGADVGGKSADPLRASTTGEPGI